MLQIIVSILGAERLVVGFERHILSKAIESYQGVVRTPIQESSKMERVKRNLGARMKDWRLGFKSYCHHHWHDQGEVYIGYFIRQKA